MKPIYTNRFEPYVGAVTIPTRPSNNRFRKHPLSGWARIAIGMMVVSAVIIAACIYNLH